MLTDPSLALLAKQNLASYVLDGGLLPMNNNASFIVQDSPAVTTLIVDENDRVVACGVVTVYSSKQAYCVVGVVAEGCSNHTIWIEETTREKKELCVYKIIRSAPYIIDYKAPTMFETVFADPKGRSVFAHLIDTLAHCSIGKTNMDVNKNMTIDLLNNDSIEHQKVVAQWRDVAGFIVSDRHRFEEVLVDRSNLLSLSDAASTIVVVNVTKDNQLFVLDYDAGISIYDRSEHVTALIQTPGITGKLALNGGQPCGYALLCNNRILLSYANNEEAFKQLLSEAAKDIVSSQCKMFLRLDAHKVTEKIIENSVERKEVTRLHTRTNVSGIKWNLIYCCNLGLHIF
ncbi:hypothetical protein KIN20_033495 [Parelaphostrongylus tenuis]|uniref:DUF7596 domain-containing protein n=1 Tax=Parelaphostrongylus tenuis TaxID=148309 RepID=A0AAD5R8I1_PARTN|nr:hypothetical protein KIN20_033495 [Parelaphostrongylus tenuis]